MIRSVRVGTALHKRRAPLGENCRQEQRQKPTNAASALSLVRTPKCDKNLEKRKLQTAMTRYAHFQRILYFLKAALTHKK